MTANQMSPLFNIGALSCIFGTIPSFLDLVVEIAHGREGLDPKHQKEKRLRLLFLAANLICGMLLVSSAISSIFLQLLVITFQSTFSSLYLLRNHEFVKSWCRLLLLMVNASGVVFCVPQMKYPLLICGGLCQFGVLCFVAFRILSRILKAQQKLVAVQAAENSTTEISADGMMLWQDYAYVIFILLVWIVKFYFTVCQQESTNSMTIAFSFLQIFPVYSDFLFHKMSTQYGSLTAKVVKLNREFVRFVSHELRSHVSHMSSGIQQLWEDAMLIQRDSNGILTELQESCIACLGVLDDILIFDRFRDGRVLSKVVGVDVKFLLRRALDSVESKMKKHKVKVALSIDLSNPLVTNIANLKLHCDVDEISQALKYLLQNAISVSKPEQHVNLIGRIVSHPGTSTEAFTWRVPSNDKVTMDVDGRHVEAIKIGYIKLDVIDQGPGLSEDNLGALFRDVNNVEYGHLMGGQASGLAMSVAKVLMKKNFGSLDAFSAGRGNGCTFTVHLPIFAVAGKTRNPNSPLTLITEPNPKPDRAEPFKDDSGDCELGLAVVGAAARTGLAEAQGEAGAVVAERKGKESSPLKGRRAAHGALHEHVATFMARFLAAVGGKTNPLDTFGGESGCEIRIHPDGASEDATEGSIVNEQALELVNQAQKALQADRVSLFVYDEMSRELECMIPLEAKGLRMDSVTGFLGASFKSRAMVNIPWVSADSKPHSEWLSKFGFSLRNVLCCPVLDRRGVVVGVLQACNKQRGGRFSKEDEGAIREVGKKLAIIISQSKAKNGLNFKGLVSHEQSVRSSMTSSFSMVRTLRFLVVDDMKVDRKMMRYSLENRLGHCVDEATSGEEALERVVAANRDMCPYDAIFMDFVMGAGMDGPAAAKAILSVGFEGKMIGWTGYTFANSDQFFRNGGHDVIEKPVPFNMVMKMVQDLERAACFKKPKSAQSARKLAPIADTDDTSPGRASGMATIKLHILVADPSKISRRTLRSILETLGHDVSEAESCEEAARLLCSPPVGYDCLFVDCSLLTLSRGEGDNPSNDSRIDLKAIGYKGKAVGVTDRDDFAYDDVVEAGVATVLNKPISQNHVKKIISDLMMNYRGVGRKEGDEKEQEQVSHSFSTSFALKPPSVEKEQDDTTTPAKDNPSSSKMPAPSKVLNCLVVDDVYSNRKIVHRMLERSGHKVVDAEDGLEAIQAFEVAISTGKPFDFIFMDFVMPNMDGPSATSILRRRGFTKTIVGLTGNVLREDVDLFRQSGANTVVGKPMSNLRLREILSCQPFDGPTT